MKKLVPVYPWPMHPKVAERLELIPGLNLVEALPGGPGPILAIRETPPFICDAVVVHTPERLADAVRIVTADGIEMVSMREMIGAVSETTEKVVAKVRFQ